MTEQIRSEGEDRLPVGSIEDFTEAQDTRQPLCGLRREGQTCGFRSSSNIVQQRQKYNFDEVGSMSEGKAIISQLKQHIINTMEGMPECKRIIGQGAFNSSIEEIADLNLNLERHNGWLCWSILVDMQRDGLIEIVPGTEKRRRWRLL